MSPRRNVTRKEIDREGFPHGTDAGYQAGCNCTRCTGAHREYQRDWRSNQRALLRAAGVPDRRRRQD